MTISILVLVCYFAALTPIHSLYHIVTSSFFEEGHKENKDKHNNAQKCYYCDITLSNEVGFLPASKINVNAIEIAKLPKSNTFFDEKVDDIFNPKYFSLRAPPVL